jgi:hypothetical protein
MWNTFNYCGEMDIRVADAMNCTPAGIDAYKIIKRHLIYYRSALDKIETESIVEELTEYGIDDVEQMSRETLEIYLMWLAFGNISEKHTEMNIHSIWDNGGETLDRYTVVFNDNDRHYKGRDLQYLSLSENGLGVSMWDYLRQRPGEHLGKKIEIDDLSSDLIDHINARLQEV